MKYLKTMISVSIALLIFNTSASAAEIHDAVNENDPARVAALLDSDPSLLELRDEQEMTPLNLAALNGNAEIARLLIERGADIHSGDADNSQPIHCAAISGNVPIIEMLLRAGANINEQDNNGATALTFAAGRGRAEMVRFLLEKGCDPGLRNNRGVTALFFAGTPEIAALMLGKGANVNEQTNDGNTPLHNAVSRGRVSLTTFLLEHGADPNARNNDGMTPIFSLRGDSALAIARLLIEHGADARTTSNEGLTPLHTAAATGSIEIADLLLAHGANVNAVNATGWTPLCMAALANSSTTAYLLSRGAEPNPHECADKEGCAHVEFETPLHLAANSDSITTVRTLVEHGALINVTNDRGLTPLHIAAGNGNTEMTDYLLLKGARVNIKEGNRGMTELHVAAIKGQTEMMERMIEAGAQTDTQDGEGKTALDHCRYHGFVRGARLVETHGATAAKHKQVAPDALHLGLKQKEAVVWYLGHSAWAIKTTGHLLVFDYARNPQRRVPEDASLASGYAVPSQISGTNTTVFITHEHGDHYDPAVFDWKTMVADIGYVLGFRPRDIEHEYTYAAPRTTSTVNGMTVTTIRSNDSGVGFLIEVDGLTILHLGDHANGSMDMSGDYTAEIDAIAAMGRRIDLCFGPILGCSLGTPESVQLGAHYAIEKLDPKVFMPMHAGHATYLGRDFCQEAAAKKYPTQLAYALNEGDRFSYCKGKLHKIE